ncbi:unnamed protein product [Gongylonema pulchrum]|uniref:Uncharacterized protein n=1 Tax=Gongylonema pulchrum TaxID=637853 RepID=A0A183DS36_9BILA|nr:unnamed protein product [Gongylonema pulchrum]
MEREREENKEKEDKWRRITKGGGKEGRSAGRAGGRGILERQAPGDLRYLWMPIRSFRLPAQRSRQVRARERGRRGGTGKGYDCGGTV